MEYQSCRLLQSGICLLSHQISPCCHLRHEGGGQVNFIPDYIGEKVDWTKYFNKRHEFIERIKVNDIPEPCRGCMFIETRNWSENNLFDYVSISHWTHCSCNCLYCFTHENKKEYNTFKYYDIFPIINDLITKNMLNNHASIELVGGEVTELKEFSQLMSILLQHEYKLKINTSGINYSKEISDALSKGIATVRVAPDTAIKTTYEKIKGVKKFEAVWNNIEKYIKAQNINLDEQSGFVMIKCIIFPGYNDSIKEIDHFISKCESIGCTYIIFDLEREFGKLYRHNIPSYIYTLVDYIKKRTLNKSYTVEFDEGIYYIYKNTSSNKLKVLSYRIIAIIFNIQKLIYKIKVKFQQIKNYKGV